MDNIKETSDKLIKDISLISETINGVLKNPEDAEKGDNLFNLLTDVEDNYSKLKSDIIELLNFMSEDNVHAVKQTKNGYLIIQE